MRDTHATGTGSIMGAGTAGYCVGNLLLDGAPPPLCCFVSCALLCFALTNTPVVAKGPAALSAARPLLTRPAHILLLS